MKMPFGKYKGKKVSSIPKDYLSWLLKECDLYEPLKGKVEKAFYPKMYTFRIDVTNAREGNGSYFLDAETGKDAKMKVKLAVKGKKAKYRIENLGRLN